MRCNRLTVSVLPLRMYYSGLIVSVLPLNIPCNGLMFAIRLTFISLFLRSWLLMRSIDFNSVDQRPICTQPDVASSPDILWSFCKHYLFVVNYFHRPRVYNVWPPCCLYETMFDFDGFQFSWRGGKYPSSLGIGLWSSVTPGKHRWSSERLVNKLLA